MNIIKNVLFSVLLVLSALSLIASPPAFASPTSSITCYNADGTSFVAYSYTYAYCPDGTSPTPPPTCSDGLPVAGGGGVWICPTITSTTTTTLGGIIILPCYYPDGSSFIGYGTCPPGTTPIPPPTCSSGLPTFDFVTNAWICPTTTTSTTSTSTSTSTTSTTTTTLYVVGDPFGYDMGISVTGSTVYPIPFHSGSYSVSYTGTITNYGPGIGVADIIFKDPLNPGSSSISLSNCVATGMYGCRATLAAGEQATVTASVGSVGLGTDTLFYLSLSDVSGDTLFETNSTNNSATLSLASPSTSTTTSTSSTTTSSATTTTLCNPYVNGTTQYPYSGSGSCHSIANDDVTGLHIVRDQSYCKKHMSHFNSKGNHVHAYPHPMCM